MARLPVPGGDDGNWGDILNEYLLTAHAADGGLKDGSIAEAKLDAGLVAKLNSTTLAISRLPAGSVLYATYNTGTSSWPARPTARTDILVRWVGGDENTPPPNAVSGLDIWDRTV